MGKLVSIVADHKIHPCLAYSHTSKAHTSRQKAIQHMSLAHVSHLGCSNLPISYYLTATIPTLSSMHELEQTQSGSLLQI